jgi:hypothetical protein
MIANKALLWCATMLSVVLMGAPAPAAVNGGAVNVGQVDGSSQAVTCPAGVSGSIPDLVLTLETRGRPVLVMFTVQIILGTNSGVDLWPVIDGRSPDDPPLPVTVKHFVGAFQGETATLSFARVYSLDRGIYTFGVQFRCQGSAQAAIRWLTLYELR